MNRATLSDAKYRDLFDDRNASAPEDDPEFITILRRLIFGEIFFIGDLDDQTRELITVVVLTTTQMLSQLKVHTGAALNVGVTPVEVREAVYQCAPFIGLPPTLNAIGVINEVFRSRGIDLPLPAQAAADEDERYDKGKAIQVPLYGDEIRNDLDDLPDELRDVVPRLLTEFCFGDFYTRTGLDVARRELLVLCLLAALGGTDAQLRPHTLGNLKVGNTKTTQIAALIHSLPYIGFPRALNAIRIVRQVTDPAKPS
jgi:4-carboxymuconolactone decarboxylase